MPICLEFSTLKSFEKFPLNVSSLCALQSRWHSHLLLSVTHSRERTHAFLYYLSSLITRIIFSFLNLKTKLLATKFGILALHTAHDYAPVPQSDKPENGMLSLITAIVILAVNVLDIN